jgi:glycosyltransferase involved in cell wall biosynthesis
MPEYFHAADFLIVTSLYESQSSVALEAMCCGTLVCGTHVGILADLSGMACLTVKPRDYNSLARTIIDLSKDKERQNILRRNARQWSEEFDHTWSANQYKQIFDSL